MSPITRPAHQLQAQRAHRLLTAEQFQRLADVPPAIEWFANLGNKATRRAYEHALQDFMQFAGVAQPGRRNSGKSPAPTSSPGATTCCSAP